MSKGGYSVLSAISISVLLTACGGSGNSVSSLNVPSRNSDATPVTDAFGALEVTEGEFDGQANAQPWSGSWLPLKSTMMFDTGTDELAPLQKYDLYMEKVHGQRTHAADTERNDPYLYDPNALGWEGRCDAWATAAIIAPEPTHAVTTHGITFSVGDLKDLVIKTYETSRILKQLGKNFAPGPDSDYSAIYPDQFHKAVQHETFENQRLMVFDSDPTEQVWNTPLYRAMFEIKADGSDEHLMHVTAYIWGVLPLGISPVVRDPNYVGAVTVNYTYTYDLYGTMQSNGKFRVAFGEWTGDSKTDHPNFVSVLTGQKDHHSANSEIENEIVQEILNN